MKTSKVLRLIVRVLDEEKRKCDETLSVKESDFMKGLRSGYRESTVEVERILRAVEVLEGKDR